MDNGCWINLDLDEKMDFCLVNGFGLLKIDLDY